MGDPGAISVLHVDDDSAFGEVVREFLEREDERITVETVTSASAGRERLREGEFDCIVSDYEMPETNGIEFLERVREHDPDLPFVLFTGQGSERIASEAISAEVTDYLQKTSGTDQYAVLANRIVNAVERYRAERALDESERRYRALIELATDAVFIQQNGRLVRANERATELTGHDEPELVARDRTLWDLAHPDDQERLKRMITTAGGDTDRSERHEVRLQTVDGTTRHCEISTRRIRYDGATAVMATARDVTNRRTREEQLDTLYGATQDLIAAETAEDIWDIAVDVLEDSLDYRMAAAAVPVDGDESGFRPVAATDLAEELLVDHPSWHGETGILSTAFQSGDVRLVDDTRTAPSAAKPHSAVTCVAVFPVGDHGALLVAERERDAFDDHIEHVGKMLAANTEAALDRVSRETRLTEINQRLEALIEATPVPIIMLDQHARVQLWNSAAHRVFGWRREEVIGETLPTLPRDRGGALATTFERVLDGESINEQLVLRRTRDGEELEMLLSAAPIRNGDGEITGSAGVLVDLEDRIDYERTVEQLHDATRRLIGAKSTEEVLETGRNAVEEILGFPPTAIRLYDPDSGALLRRVGSEWADDMLGERPTYEVDASPPGRAFRTGDPVHETIGANDQYGREALSEALYVPVADHGVISIGTSKSSGFSDADVRLAEILAANVAAALDRLERRQDLSRRNEQLEQFASIVSHDLRTPLSVLDGSLELAEDTGDPEHFGRCYRAVDRMGELIEDLLTLARQDEDLLEVSAVDLPEVAEACWQTVSTTDATLEVDTDLVIQGDGGQVRQLLENLIENGVTHGGDDVTIRIGTIDDASGFYVEDDGPGIPADQREAVFDVGVSTASDGTGLGLAIVDRIVDAHGWDVTLTASESGGARFEITGVDVE